jgi:membrane protease YdiL (CAAX protease family)
MRRHPLFAYFAFALGLSWVYEFIAFALFHLPMIPWGAPALIVGPTLAAFLMAWATEGRAGVLDLLHRFILWRVGARWHLFALFAIPATVLLSYLVIPGNLAAFRVPAPTFALTYLVYFIGVFILGGALFEEPGWRGFALPRLQGRFGPLVGSLVLGALWSVWHLPFFLFIAGYNGAGPSAIDIGAAFALFAVRMTAFTFIITWLFNNARGSLLTTMLVHASLNAATNFVPKTPEFAASLAICLVGLALAVGVATRGRLGYPRYQREIMRPGVGGGRGQERGGSAFRYGGAER